MTVKTKLRKLILRALIRFVDAAESRLYEWQAALRHELAGIGKREHAPSAPALAQRRTVAAKSRAARFPVLAGETFEQWTLRRSGVAPRTNTE